MPRGRPPKDPSAPDTEKKRLNRERVARHKAKIANEVSSVVEDFIDCDEERKVLNAKVKSLTTMLNNCKDQVGSIMNDVKNMGSKKSRPATSTKMAAASTIVGAVRGKIARSKAKEQEKQTLFDIMLK